MAEVRPVVAHFTKRYIDPTHSWLHAQIHFQRRWRSVVLSQRTTRRAGDFPVDTHLSLAQLSWPRRAWNELRLRADGRAPFFLAALRKEKARLIHAHFGQGGFRILNLAQRSRLPLVTTFYGADLSLFPRRDPRWRERYQPLFEAGALFLVEGPHMCGQLAALGCPLEKIHVHHLGVDLTRFQATLRAPDADGTVRVLTVGRFTEKKGIEYAVEAFCRAAPRLPKARLTVIGAAGRRRAEQEVLLRIEEIIRRYGAQDVVELAGMRSYDELTAAYGSHHILLAPSVESRDGDNEGGAPVAVVEAQATAMPVIATTHCDIPEVVENGEGGLLLPERDVDSLADALVALAAAPDKWVRMGVAGRARIEREFDARTQADRLADAYDRVTRDD